MQTKKLIYFIALKEQIRETVSGAENFIATYALIVTWKSVAFMGNSLNDIDLRPVRFRKIKTSLTPIIQLVRFEIYFKRNTFQATILSNSNYTFAIFNYEEVNWYASTSQGGNPETGTGGKAAKVLIYFDLTYSKVSF